MSTLLVIKLQINMCIILFLFVTSLYINVLCTHLPTGTVLFHKSDATKKCWTNSEKQLLIARKLVEGYLPHPNELDFTDANVVGALLKYLRTTFHVARETTSGDNQRYVLHALADAVGGYLRSFVLPATRAAYYAGIISYEHAKLVFALYEDLKTFLHAPKHSWRAPESGVFDTQLSVAPLQISSAANAHSCDYLLILDGRALHRRKRSSQTEQWNATFQPELSIDEPIDHSEEKTESVVIGMPMLNHDKFPTAIVLPWKEAPVLSLTSNASAYIVAKFYVHATKCINARSKSKQDIIHFNTQLYRWITAEVLPHLEDEHWYVGFGAILRVLESIKLFGINVNDEGTEVPNGNYIFSGAGVEVGGKPPEQNISPIYTGPIESWSSRSHRLLKQAFGAMSRYGGNTKSHIILLVTFLVLLLSVLILCFCCSWCRKINSNTRQGEAPTRPFYYLPTKWLMKVREMLKAKIRRPESSQKYGGRDQINNMDTRKVPMSPTMGRYEPKSTSKSISFATPSSDSLGVHSSERSGAGTAGRDTRNGIDMPSTSGLAANYSGRTIELEGSSKKVSNGNSVTRIMPLMTSFKKLSYIEKWRQNDGTFYGKCVSNENQERPRAAGDGWTETECTPLREDFISLPRTTVSLPSGTGPLAHGNGWTELDCRQAQPSDILKTSSILEGVSRRSSSFIQLEQLTSDSSGISNNASSS